MKFEISGFYSSGGLFKLGGFTFPPLDGPECMTVKSMIANDELAPFVYLYQNYKISNH